MTREPSIITEHDPEGDDLPSLPSIDIVDVPDLIVNTERGGGASRRQVNQQKEPEIEVIEVDEYNQPFGQPQQTQPADNGQPQEGNLDEEPPATSPRQSKPSELYSRSERRRHAKNRDQQRIQQLEQMLAEHADQLAKVAPRVDQFEQVQRQGQIANLNHQIQQQVDRAVRARMALTTAMQNGDAEAMARALDERDNALITGQRLTATRNVMVSGSPLYDQPPQQQPQAQRQQQVEPPPSPRVMRRVTEFMEDHPWYDPNGGDIDSQLVLAIDRHIAAQGFDPNGDDYWDEFDTLLRERVPHRFRPAARQQNAQPQSQQRQSQQQPQVAPQRRGPAAAGSVDRAPAVGKGQVYIDPGRKQGLIDAGVLDRDGKTVLQREKYQRLLNHFSEYDRSNNAARR